MKDLLNREEKLRLELEALRLERSGSAGAKVSAALTYERAKNLMEALRCYREAKCLRDAAYMAEELGDPWGAERLHEDGNVPHDLRGLFLNLVKDYYTDGSLLDLTSIYGQDEAARRELAWRGFSE